MDASLQDLRRVRDGLNDRAGQRRDLEKCLADVKLKDQGPDVVILADLCRSLELPLATTWDEKGRIGEADRCCFVG